MQKIVRKTSQLLCIRRIVIFLIFIVFNIESDHAQILKQKKTQSIQQKYSR